MLKYLIFAALVAAAGVHLADNAAQSIAAHRAAASQY